MRSFVSVPARRDDPLGANLGRSVAIPRAVLPPCGRMRAVSFPPPPPSPTDPPAPGQWQPAPQPAPQPYGQQPYPPQPYPPQPPTQQGYGAHPPAPMGASAPEGRSWVVPAVVLASLVTIGGVFAASAARSGDDVPDAASEARDAVVRLTDSMSQGDCAGVEAASTGGYFRSMNLTCDDIAENGRWMTEMGMSFVIGDADLEGDTAEVPVQIVVTGDPTQNGSGHFTVVRTGDSWRVSNDQTD